MHDIRARNRKSFAPNYAISFAIPNASKVVGPASTPSDDDVDEVWADVWPDRTLVPPAFFRSSSTLLDTWSRVGRSDLPWLRIHLTVPTRSDENHPAASVLGGGDGTGPQH